MIVMIELVNIIVEFLCKCLYFKDKAEMLRTHHIT